MKRAAAVAILFLVGALVPRDAVTEDTTVRIAESATPGTIRQTVEIPDQERNRAGVLKSEAEATKLDLLQLVFALLGGLIAAGAALYTARRNRLGTFDQAVLEWRLEKFGKLVDAAEDLALYFPTAELTPANCNVIGHKLRARYFSGLGILLTPDARDRYFLLMRALSRATVASRLNVPTLEDYPRSISKEMIDDYRKRLKFPKQLQGDSTEDLQMDLTGGDALVKLQEYVERWDFGMTLPESGSNDAADAAHRFRDFVLLQALASHLRTALTVALRGRDRPN